MGIVQAAVLTLQAAVLQGQSYLLCRTPSVLDSVLGRGFQLLLYLMH
jgi:hypothetical protein